MLTFLFTLTNCGIFIFNNYETIKLAIPFKNITLFSRLLTSL